MFSRNFVVKQLNDLKEDIYIGIKTNAFNEINQLFQQFNDLTGEQILESLPIAMKNIENKNIEGIKNNINFKKFNIKKEVLTYILLELLLESLSITKKYKKLYIDIKHLHEAIKTDNDLSIIFKLE